VKVLEWLPHDQINKNPPRCPAEDAARRHRRARSTTPIFSGDEPTGASIGEQQSDHEAAQKISKTCSSSWSRITPIWPRLNPPYHPPLDGAVTGDTHPYDGGAETAPAPARKGRLSMAFGTALSLSLKNLMTKKARTILTAFAGSIGIIGIALIMALSNGIQMYIDRVQEDTLSSYPIEIDAKAADLSSLVSAISGAHKDADSGVAHGEDAVYSNVIFYDLMNNLTSANTQTNNLKAFKAYLDDPDCPVRQYASAIQYTYDANFTSTPDKDGATVKSYVIELMQKMMTKMTAAITAPILPPLGDITPASTSGRNAGGRTANSSAIRSRTSTTCSHGHGRRSTRVVLIVDGTMCHDLVFTPSASRPKP
jgi:putative ABC transport system permease protein